MQAPTRSRRLAARSRRILSPAGSRIIPSYATCCPNRHAHIPLEQSRNRPRWRHSSRNKQPGQRAGFREAGRWQRTVGKPVLSWRSRDRERPQSAELNADVFFPRSIRRLGQDFQNASDESHRCRPLRRGILKQEANLTIGKAFPSIKPWDGPKGELKEA